MKISVVTCSWNSIRFVAQTVRSLERQKFRNLECVFVDGGSTDGTLDVVSACSRSHRIIRDARGGISKAMNEGVRAANGDVIAHLHADDYYLHDHVLAQVADAFLGTGCKWLFGRIVSDIEGKLLPEPYLIPRYTYARLLRRNFIPHAATFVRREVFEEVGLFDESLRFAMDYDMWLRIGRLHVPLQLDMPLAAFRRHPGSATEGNYLASFREDFRVRLRHASMVTWPEHVARFTVRRARLASRRSRVSEA